MYVERTNYFAKPGMADRVLAVRRKACEVRRRLGLPIGAIHVKHGAQGEGPDVTWECRFADVAAHERDMRARAESGDFGDVRAEIGGLIDRFERHVARIEAARPGLAPVSVAGAPIVPREVTFRSGDKLLTGFLYLPPGPGPFACVITNHGSSISQGSSDLCRPGAASLLLSWGFASFLPHRAGYGSSPGAPWLEEVSAPFGTPDYDDQLAARLGRESDDVLAALDWVGAQPEIDPMRIAVMGSSFGGTVTLLAASRTDRFACAVEFAGAAMNWERTPKLRDSMKTATRRIGRPIFFLQSETDYSTAPTRELGEIVAREKPDSKARIYPAFGISKDEGHLFEKAGALVWGPEVREFLTRWT